MQVLGKFAVLSACAIGGFVACAGERSPTSPRPTVSISVAEVGAAVARGASRSTPITITRPAGAPSVVILSADSVPAGVTVTFLPKRLEIAETSSVATVTVSSGAEPRDLTLIFRATDAAQASATVPFVLAILPPTIVVTRDGDPLSAVRGGYPVTTFLGVVKQSGAAGTVSFSVDSVPPGVVASFASATIGTLTMTASESAPLGTQFVRIRASLPGVPDAFFSLPLSVVAYLDPTLPGSPGFTLHPVNAMVSVEAGKIANPSIEVSRTNNFSGPVAFSLDSADSRLQIDSVPNNLGALLSPLTLRVAAGTPAGEYILRLRGRAALLIERTVSFRVLVRNAFFLAATDITTRVGGVGSSSISIVRSAAFDGAVSLSTGTLPSYVTASLNPATTVGPFSSLTLTVARDAPPGTVLIDVFGDGGNEPRQRVSIRLVITP